MIPLVSVWKRIKHSIRKVPKIVSTPNPKSRKPEGAPEFWNQNLLGRMAHHWSRWRAGEASKRCKIEFKPLEDEKYLRVSFEIPPDYLNHEMGIVAEHGDTVGIYPQNYGRFLALLMKMGTGRDLTANDGDLNTLLEEADDDSLHMQATQPVPEGILQKSGEKSLGIQAFQKDNVGQKYTFKRANARKDNAMAYNRAQEYTYEEALRHVQLNGINIEFLDWVIAKIEEKLELDPNYNAHNVQEELRKLQTMARLFKEFRVSDGELLVTDNNLLPERQNAAKFWEAAKLMEHTNVLEVLDYLGKLGIPVPIDTFLDLQGLNEKKVYTIASRKLREDESQEIEINFSISATYKPGPHSFGTGKFAREEDGGAYRGTATGLFHHLNEERKRAGTLKKEFELDTFVEARFFGDIGKPMATKALGGQREELSEYDKNRMETETPFICTMGTGTAALQSIMQYRQAVKENYPNLTLKPAIVVLGVRNKDEFFIGKDQLQDWANEGLIKKVIYVESRNEDGSKKAAGKRYLQSQFTEIYGQELENNPGEKLVSIVCGDANMGMGIWHGMEENFYGYDEEMDLSEQRGEMMMSASGGGLYKEEAPYLQEAMLEELEFVPIDLKGMSIAQNIKAIDLEKEAFFEHFKKDDFSKKIPLRYGLKATPEVYDHSFRIFGSQEQLHRFIADLRIRTRNAKKPHLACFRVTDNSIYISAETLLFVLESGDKGTENAIGKKEKHRLITPSGIAEGGFTENLRKVAVLERKRAFILDYKRHNHTSYLKNGKGVVPVPDALLNAPEGESEAAKKIREEKLATLKNATKKARRAAMQEAENLAGYRNLTYSNKKKQWHFFDPNHGQVFARDESVEKMAKNEFFIRTTPGLGTFMSGFFSHNPFHGWPSEFKRLGTASKKGQTLFVDGVDDLDLFDAQGDFAAGANADTAAKNSGHVDSFMIYGPAALYILTDGLKGALDEVLELESSVKNKKTDLHQIKRDLQTIEEDLKRMGEMKGPDAAKAEWNPNEVRARLEKLLKRIAKGLNREQWDLFYAKLEKDAISGMMAGLATHGVSEAVGFAGTNIPLELQAPEASAAFNADSTSHFLGLTGTTMAAAGQMLMTLVAARTSVKKSYQSRTFYKKKKYVTSSLNQCKETNVKDFGFTLDKEHQQAFAAFLHGKGRANAMSAGMNAALSVGQALMFAAWVISIVQTGGATAGVGAFTKGFAERAVEAALVEAIRAGGAYTTIASAFSKSIFEAALLPTVFREASEEQLERIQGIMQGKMPSQAKIALTKQIADNEAIPQFLHANLYTYVNGMVSYITHPKLTADTRVAKTSLFKGWIGLRRFLGRTKKQIVNAFEYREPELDRARYLLNKHLHRAQQPTAHGKTTHEILAEADHFFTDLHVKVGAAKTLKVGRLRSFLDKYSETRELLKYIGENPACNVVVKVYKNIRRRLNQLGQEIGSLVTSIVNSAVKLFRNKIQPYLPISRIAPFMAVSRKFSNEKVAFVTNMAREKYKKAKIRLGEVFAAFRQPIDKDVYRINSFPEKPFKTVNENGLTPEEEDELVDLIYENFVANLKSGVASPLFFATGYKSSLYQKNNFSKPILNHLKKEENQMACKTYIRRVLVSYKKDRKDKRFDALCEAMTHSDFLKEPHHKPYTVKGLKVALEAIEDPANYDSIDDYRYRSLKEAYETYKRDKETYKDDDERLQHSLSTYKKACEPWRKENVDLLYAKKLQATFYTMCKKEGVTLSERGEALRESFLTDFFLQTWHLELLAGYDTYFETADVQKIRKNKFGWVPLGEFLVGYPMHGVANVVNYVARKAGNKTYECKGRRFYWWKNRLTRDFAVPNLSWKWKKTSIPYAKVPGVPHKTYHMHRPLLKTLRFNFRKDKKLYHFKFDTFFADFSKNPGDPRLQYLGEMLERSMQNRLVEEAKEKEGFFQALYFEAPNMLMDQKLREMKEDKKTKKGSTDEKKEYTLQVEQDFVAEFYNPPVTYGPAQMPIPELGLKPKTKPGKKLKRRNKNRKKPIRAFV